jgi:hypothetical protein
MYSIAESLSKALGIDFEKSPELSDESMLSGFDKTLYRTNNSMLNCKGYPNIWKGKTNRYSPEHRKNLAFKSSNAYKSKEAREKHANTIRGEGNPCYATRWINKKGNQKRVPYSELDFWKTQGWLEGRLINRNNKGQFTYAV